MSVSRYLERQRDEKDLKIPSYYSITLDRTYTLTPVTVKRDENTDIIRLTYALKITSPNGNGMNHYITSVLDLEALIHPRPQPSLWQSIFGYEKKRSPLWTIECQPPPFEDDHDNIEYIVRSAYYKQRNTPYKTEVWKIMDSQKIANLVEM